MIRKTIKFLILGIIASAQTVKAGETPADGSTTLEQRYADVCESERDIKKELDRIGISRGEYFEHSLYKEHTRSLSEIPIIAIAFPYVNFVRLFSDAMEKNVPIDKNKFNKVCSKACGTSSCATMYNSNVWLGGMPFENSVMCRVLCKPKDVSNCLSSYKRNYEVNRRNGVEIFSDAEVKSMDSEEFFTTYVQDIVNDFVQNILLDTVYKKFDISGVCHDKRAAFEEEKRLLEQAENLVKKVIEESHNAETANSYKRILENATSHIRDKVFSRIKAAG